MKGTLAVTGEAEADELLNRDPLALLIGMLLDQQVPMEWAFRAPLVLRDRLGGTLDAPAMAAMDPAALEALFRQRPALHRYPGSMATRTHALCQHLVEHYGGDAAALWDGAADGADLHDRLRALPGFGADKARIFLALLAKRFGRAPAGWEVHAGPFADATPRSVADVDCPAALSKVRAFKKEMKAQGKGKAD